MRTRLLIGASFALLACTASLHAREPAAAGRTSPPGRKDADPLFARFVAPDEAARPRVWWHWIDGNVTRDGIARDLAWMKRVGIGGFQLFDGSFGYPALVPHPVAFQSPEWQDLLRFTAQQADRLGLEMTIAASGGWSETGGPWVRPAQGMKKLVWSETRVRGGDFGHVVLNALPIVSGPYQDLPRPAAFSLGPSAPPANVVTAGGAVRVLAFPTPAAENAPAPRVTTSAPITDSAALTDGHLVRVASLPVTAEGNWVRYDFGRAVTVRTLRITLGFPAQTAPGMPQGEIQASDDGVRFRTIAKLPAADPDKFPPEQPNATLALPPTTARWFRVTLVPNRGFAGAGPAAPVTSFPLAELAFGTGARVTLAEAKAGYGTRADLATSETPAVPAAATIPLDGIIDVTTHVRADGTLDWTPPAQGDWTVMRFGWSLTGVENHPGTPQSTGLEVDKYAAADVRDYLDHYYAAIDHSLGGLQGQHGLRALLTDSWEAGTANWTPAMIAEFNKRRGYDPVHFLPVLAGRIVGDAATSDRFLWDFRRTLADLLSDQHFRTLASFAKEKGLSYYAEAPGTGLPTNGDGLQAKRFPTVPMGEFWTPPPGAPSDPKHVADIREAASAAHVYGQNIVGAESFTALPVAPPFSTVPADLKPLADRFLAQGVNRFVIHASVHQPLDRGPGLTLGPFGQFFTRLESWGELASGWTSYLARTSAMLQQGRPGSDVLYLYGEGAPVTVPDGGRTDPALPAGFGVDFVARDVVLNDLRVEGGQIVAPSGTRYRMLVLPSDTRRLSLAMVEALGRLAQAGAILVAPKPIGAAGLSASDVKVEEASAALWGDLDGRTKTVRAVGRGRVYWGLPIADILVREEIRPAVTITGGALGTDVVAIERRLDQGNLFFLASQGDKPLHLEASFAVDGRVPSLWDPMIGTRRPVSYTRAGGRTSVPLDLGAHESMFVVFDTQGGPASRTIATPVETPLATIAGAWTVHFDGPAAPPPARLAAGDDWSRSPTASQRYFSGTATYSHTLNLSAGVRRSGRRLMLDLGKVGDIARVTVNGREAGVAWAAPYRVDVTDSLVRGANRIEIAVANRWTNRLIGDQQPGAVKVAFSTFPIPSYRADSPLMPSGLLAPVRLIAIDGSPR